MIKTLNTIALCYSVNNHRASKIIATLVGSILPGCLFLYIRIVISLLNTMKFCRITVANKLVSQTVSNATSQIHTVWSTCVALCPTNIGIGKFEYKERSKVKISVKAWQIFLWIVILNISIWYEGFKIFSICCYLLIATYSCLYYLFQYYSIRI